MTEHVSYRLPASIGEQIDSAAAEKGSFRSELVRQAIKYYLAENPDEIQ
jgi:metal-responsive CopG/Arc/MetJ family transcriptional regulator